MAYHPHKYNVDDNGVGFGSLSTLRCLTKLWLSLQAAIVEDLGPLPDGASDDYIQDDNLPDDVVSQTLIRIIPPQVKQLGLEDTSGRGRRLVGLVPALSRLRKLIVLEEKFTFPEIEREALENVCKVGEIMLRYGVEREDF